MSSAIDYDKLKAVQALEQILGGLREGSLELVDIYGCQRTDGNKGLTIFTRPNDEYYQRRQFYGGK